MISGPAWVDLHQQRTHIKRVRASDGRPTVTLRVASGSRLDPDVVGPVKVMILVDDLCTGGGQFAGSQTHTKSPLILIWFRKQEDATLLGAGFGVSRATAYRYLAEGKALAVANRSVNRLLHGLRWQAERGFAILVGR